MPKFQKLPKRFQYAGFFSVEKWTDRKTVEPQQKHLMWWKRIALPRLSKIESIRGPCFGKNVFNMTILVNVFQESSASKTFSQFKSQNVDELQSNYGLSNKKLFCWVLAEMRHFVTPKEDIYDLKCDKNLTQSAEVGSICKFPQ